MGKVAMRGEDCALARYTGLMAKETAFEHWTCDNEGDRSVLVSTKENCFACTVMARRDLQERVKRLEREVAALSDMVRNPAFAFEPIVRSILSRAAAFVSRKL